MFAIHNLKLRQEKLGRFPHRFAVGMPVESRFVYRKSDASYQRVVSRLLSALATYDAVHFLGSSQALVFLITPLKRLGVRVIVSEHANHWALSPVGQRQDRFAEAFQMSNIVVATTRIMRENIALRAPEVPVRVIPNVLDPVFLRHRNSYGSPRYGAVIVGRLTAERGVADFLRYLNPTALRPNSIAIIGDGADRQRVLGILRTKNIDVHWVPKLSPEGVCNVIQDSRLLVWPSRVDSFGIPVIEALSLGVPVIAGDSPGVAEIRGFGNLARTITIVKQHSEKAISQAVDHALGCPSSDLLSAASFVRDRFSPKRYAADYSDVYTDGGGPRVN